MNTQKLFTWKICFSCFLFALTSCKPTVVVQEPDTGPIKFIDGYLDVPNAVLINAYCILSEDNTNGIAIASSEINNGNFKLILPDTLDDKFLYGTFGESNEYFELSCPNVRGAIINYIEIYNSFSATDSHRIGQVFCGKYFEKRNTAIEYYVHEVNKVWYYADKDVTIKGTGNQGHQISTYDLSLKKGWNEAYWEEITDLNRQTGAYTWTLIITSKKSEKYKDLKWYIWDGTW